MEAAKNPISLLDALFQVFNAQEVLITENASILKHQKSISESVEKKRNTKKNIIVALVNFLSYSTATEFQKIFGESLGSHLWAKFYNNGKYSYNFLTEVSNHNLIILENYLKKGDY